MDNYYDVQISDKEDKISIAMTFFNGGQVIKQKSLKL
jgi:hypothetical protein